MDKIINRVSTVMEEKRMRREMESGVRQFWGKMALACPCKAAFEPELHELTERVGQVPGT